MLSKHTTIKNSLFDQIYQFAREDNEEALFEIANEKRRNVLNIHQGQPSPIMLLAKEGNVAAVELLIRLGANIDDAMQGYGWGGHKAQVDDLLKRNADMDSALLGYAYGGYIDAVEKLLKSGESIDSAVFGYAFGGYTAEVEKLLKHGASIDLAVRGYALGGHENQVNDLLKRGADIDSALQSYAMGGYAVQAEKLIIPSLTDPEIFQKRIHSATTGYRAGGHLADYETTLRVLSLTNDIAIRTMLAEAAKRHLSLSVKKTEKLLRHSTKLNHIITQYKVDFDEALSIEKALKRPELRIWFLQGKKLVENENLSQDTFIHISSFVARVSNEKTQDLFSHSLNFFNEKIAKKENSNKEKDVPDCNQKKLA